MLSRKFLLDGMDGLSDAMGNLVQAQGLLTDREGQGQDENIAQFIKSATERLSEAKSKVDEFLKYQPSTMTMDGLIHRIVNLKCTNPGNDQELLRMYFEEYPFLKIREAIIQEMKHTECDEEWVEKWIGILDCMSRGNPSRDENNKNLCWNLFQWYVVGSHRGSNEHRIHALEYACTKILDGSLKSIDANSISKIICRDVKFNKELWYEIPSMRKLILKMLYRICPLGSERNCYSEKDWMQTARAIECIIQLGDVSYISHLEEISKILRFGKLTCSYEDFAAQEMHRTFLGKAITVLDENRKTQWPKINDFSGAIDLIACKLELHCRLKFELYNLSDKSGRDPIWGKITAKAGDQIIILAKISDKFYASKEDCDFREEIDLFMSRFTLNGCAFGPDGLVATPLFPQKNPRKSSWPLNSMFVRKEDEYGHLAYQAGISIIPANGQNKLEINLCSDNDPIFSGTFYIIGEDENPESEKQL